MRITQKMTNMQLLQNLQNNNNQLNNYQNMLSSGQKIQKPEDNPVGIGYVMRYDTELSRASEYEENANTALGMLNTMDSLMQQSTDVLHRASTLVQQASTGTVPADVRQQMAAEITQLREQMVQIGNSDFNGNYLFNGQKTDVPPYTSATAGTDTTDKGVFRLNVSPTSSVPVSITGEQIFGPTDTAATAPGTSTNVFSVLNDIANDMKGNDQAALLKDIDRIQTVSDNISTQRAEIGARTNRFNLIVSRIQDQTTGLKQLRSNIDDVDIAKVITDLKTAESVQQAALSTGARLIQNSIIDFIK
jgi:flagellar hook-associated protein 3 FlgL